MSEIKQRMSSGYRVIFALFILMVPITIIFSQDAHNRVTGPAPLLWGYASWLMYKHKYDKLISLERFLLWMSGFTVALGLFFIAKPDSDFLRLLPISASGFIVLGVLNFALSLFLLRYFKSYKDSSLGNGKSHKQVSDEEIEDTYWQQALAEFESNRSDAAWARAFSTADGDEAKAKALYIRIRAHNLRDTYVELVNRETSIKKVVEIRGDLKRSTSMLIGVALVFVGIAAIIYIDESKKSSALSMTRGYDWVQNASSLHKDIVAGKIDDVSDMLVTRTDSSASKLNQRYGKANAISPLYVALIEEKKIWWVQDNSLFIRLQNPMGLKLFGLLFTMDSAQCGKGSTDKFFLALQLDGEPLAGGKYAVYKGKLPFDYSSSFGAGTICGLVEAGYSSSSEGNQKH